MTQSVAISEQKNKPLTDSLVLNPVFKYSILTVFTCIAKGSLFFSPLPSLINKEGVDCYAPNTDATTLLPCFLGSLTLLPSPLT